MTVSEADQQFLKIVHDEFGLEPVLKQVGATLWIYVPGKREIFTIQAQEESHSQAKKKKFEINRLDGKYEDRNFIFEYDVAPTEESGNQSKGLANAYSEAFNEEYRNVFIAVSRVYLNSKGLLTPFCLNQSTSLLRGQTFEGKWK